MGKRVDSWESDDGQLHKTERDMVLHEARLAITEEMPELKSALGLIMAKIDRLAEIISPVRHCPPKIEPQPVQKDHPATPENHPEADPAYDPNAPLEFGCQALQHSDQISCVRCNLRWDVNDPEPPACGLLRA